MLREVRDCEEAPAEVGREGRREGWRWRTVPGVVGVDRRPRRTCRRKVPLAQSMRRREAPVPVSVPVPLAAAAVVEGAALEGPGGGAGADEDQVRVGRAWAGRGQ